MIKKRILFFVCVNLFFLTSFSGCKVESEHRIVIWTNNSEFAQYVELFNKTNKTDSAVLVYKENPASSLPPAKDENPPDLVVSSYLRSSSLENQFKSLDYLFDRQYLESSDFYETLLSSGKSHFNQYLLPVSFNLPAIIFSEENAKESGITDSFTLGIDEIQEISTNWNVKRQNGNYSRMGFTPLATEGFAYLTAKIFESDFHEEKRQISYNSQNLQNSVEYLKNWIKNANTSAQTETDFAYKYLFMPDYRRVTSGRTLFALMKSDRLFNVLKSQELKIDYRWISTKTNEENSTSTEIPKIPIEDDFTMMGIYKNSKNQPGATKFIKWFFEEENQKEILKRKSDLNLNTENFGIAGGFSSLKSVTEHVLPLYYRELLTNIPQENQLLLPDKLPSFWENYRENVVNPYLEAAIQNENPETFVEIKTFEDEWRKKMFN